MNKVGRAGCRTALIRSHFLLSKEHTDTMTKDEKQYASDRVEHLVSQAHRHYKEKFSEPGASPSPEEMLSALCSGEVTPSNARRYGDTLKIDIVGDWPGEKERVRGERTEEFEEAMAPIREKAQEIKDDIYLGDSEAALNAIQELSEIVP